jgi:hypothetical protein
MALSYQCLIGFEQYKNIINKATINPRVKNGETYRIYGQFLRFFEDSISKHEDKKIKLRNLDAAYYPNDKGYFNFNLL